MIQEILSHLFGNRQPEFVSDPRTYQIVPSVGAWGDIIQWVDWPTRQVVGWKTPKPRIGDHLETQMKSGRMARFRFTEITPCPDPPEMFFGKVQDVGYLN